MTADGDVKTDSKEGPEFVKERFLAPPDRAKDQQKMDPTFDYNAWLYDVVLSNTGRDEPDVAFLQGIKNGNLTYGPNEYPVRIIAADKDGQPLMMHMGPWVIVALKLDSGKSTFKCEYAEMYSGLYREFPSAVNWPASFYANSLWQAYQICASLMSGDMNWADLYRRE